MESTLQNMRAYFNSGATKSYAFRMAQLQKLKEVVERNEQKIAEALYKDLRKSREESYGTETGLLLAEINNAIKNLNRWMKPSRVGTNLLNFPASSKIYREPLGVIFIIAPWNYPFQLSLLPLVGAIAGGNCAVIKPSELAQATALVIQEIIAETFNVEYIRVVTGDGATVVSRLMDDFRFDHIFFTGSIPVGRAIYTAAAKKLTTVTLELGGKSPAVVDADANIPVAARRIVFGKFTNAGQTCIAPDYVLVHEHVKERLVDEMKKAIVQFFGNDPIQSDSYGRIINEKRFNTLINYLSQGQVLHGGQYDANEKYISPTVMDSIDISFPIMQEEIFGPILPVLAFSDLSEAINIVRANPDPLAFYIFSGNNKSQEKWISDMAFGGGCVNNAILHFANHHLPFGGIRNSGTGVYHGKFSFECFTHAKAVMKSPVWLDPSVKYPPYTGKLRMLKWFVR